MPKPENIIDKGFDQHPENINKNGRPKKLIKQLAEVIGHEFNIQLTKSDIYDLIKWALERNSKELEKISDDPQSPAFLVSITTAILGDIKNKRTSTIEMIFDRVFGKAVQKNEEDVNVKFNKVSIKEIRVTIDDTRKQ